MFDLALERVVLLVDDDGRVFSGRQMPDGRDQFITFYNAEPPKYRFLTARPATEDDLPLLQSAEWQEEGTMWRFERRGT